MKMEQTECSEMLAYKFQMSGNYPEESIQRSEHGKSLKSRILSLLFAYVSLWVPENWFLYTPSPYFNMSKQSHRAISGEHRAWSSTGFVSQLKTGRLKPLCTPMHYSGTEVNLHSINLVFFQLSSCNFVKPWIQISAWWSVVLIVHKLSTLPKVFIVTAQPGLPQSLFLL